MGDWCSEALADTSTFEISARVMTLKTWGGSNTSSPGKKKLLFLAYGDPFSLDRAF
jgi:hypothetical protein